MPATLFLFCLVVPLFVTNRMRPIEIIVIPHTHSLFPARSRKAAPCKHSFAPPAQACPKRENAHQGNYKGSDKGNIHPQSACSSPTKVMKKGVRRKTGPPSSSAPSPSAFCLLSSSFSLRSRSFYSDASLCASSSAYAGTLLPTSVAERKSRIARRHLESARRPQILNRTFPPPSLPPNPRHRIFSLLLCL